LKLTAGVGELARRRSGLLRFPVFIVDHHTILAIAMAGEGPSPLNRDESAESIAALELAGLPPAEREVQRKGPGLGCSLIGG